MRGLLEEFIIHYKLEIKIKLTLKNCKLCEFNLELES